MSAMCHVRVGVEHGPLHHLHLHVYFIYVYMYVSERVVCPCAIPHEPCDIQMKLQLQKCSLP